MPANVAIIIGYLWCLHQLLFYFLHGFSIVPLDVGGQWINTGGTETKTYKTAFWRCQCFAPVVSVAACLISSRCLNQPHNTPNAALPSEGGGIAKRIKPLAFGEKPNPVGPPIIVVLYWISAIWCGREVSRPYHTKSFWEIWCGYLPRKYFIIMGFSPWNGEWFLSLVQRG